LKEEAQDRTCWRTQFGRGCGPVARQTTWTWRERCVISNFRICSRNRMMLCCCGVA
jgi:hypothetical protein